MAQPHKTSNESSLERQRAHPLLVIVWVGMMLGVLALVALVWRADFTGVIPTAEEAARLAEAAKHVGPAPLIILLELIIIAVLTAYAVKQ